MWRIWRVPNNARKWQMGFNLAFKGLILLTYSMEQNPSSEANRFSDSQEIPRIWNPKVHYRIHKCPPPVLYPEPAQSTPCPIPLSENQSYYYYYPQTYVWVFQVDSFPQVSPTKPCIHLSFPPYVLHARPSSLFSISSIHHY